MGQPAPIEGDIITAVGIDRHVIFQLPCCFATAAEALQKIRIMITLSSRCSSSSSHVLNTYDTDQRPATMLRNALRATTSVASTSMARPVVARGIARPLLAQAVAKRGYHEKVIDHYENPRNVSRARPLPRLPSLGLSQLPFAHHAGSADADYPRWAR